MLRFTSPGDAKVPSRNARSTPVGHLADAALPLLPAVDVGNEDRALPRAVDAIADGVGELVAMRHAERGDADGVRDGDRPIELDRPPLDVAERDELTPRPVGVEELEHLVGGVDRHRTRVDRLAPEIHQPGVMPDVRVREEDAVGWPAAGERVNLRVEVRRRVEEKRAAARAIDQAEARDALARRLPGADRHAQRLLAVELRDARVLRDAEDDDLPVSGRRRLRQRATLPTRRAR